MQFTVAALSLLASALMVAATPTPESLERRALSCPASTVSVGGTSVGSLALLCCATTTGSGNVGAPIGTCIDAVIATGGTCANKPGRTNAACCAAKAVGTSTANLGEVWIECVPPTF